MQAAPPATSVTPAPAATAKVRDPWFDNAKMALVTLVVIGHAWTLLPQSTTNRWVYDFLYTFHVPALVLVTGYLSKSFTWEPARLRSLFTTVVIPYIVFETLLAAFRVYVGREDLGTLYANPHWPMWYLSALFFWRLVTPIFKWLPAKVVMAVALSLVAGLKAGDTLDMARILGLLPFFVLGLKMHAGHWDLLRRPRVRVYAVVVLVAIFVLARFTDSLIATEWLYYRSRYDVLDPNDMKAITIRMVLLLVGLSGAMAFLSLVPRNFSWFTRLGPATLVVYLCHGFFVLGVGYTAFPGWAADHLTLSLALTSLAALGLALALGSPPVAHWLNFLVDPVGSIKRLRLRRRKRRDPAPTSA